MLGRKKLTPEVWEKYLTQAKPPILPSNTKAGQQTVNCWRAFIMWRFLRLKFCISRLKDTNGKRMFKKMLSFLFVNKRELFAMKLSFEEFNLVFFAAGQSAWLVLNQPWQRGFWRNLRYILYSLVPWKKNQYSQRFCAAIILAPFTYLTRPRVICKGTSEENVKQKKDGVRLCNAEKDLPKVNSTVVFSMHSDWSGLWICANFRYVIIFSGFEKITPRY